MAKTITKTRIEPWREMRTVDNVMFSQLKCNRCGDCCKEFSLPQPIELLRAAERMSADDWWFVGAVEPVGDDTTTGRMLCNCPYFRRDNPDAATCTIHPHRPDICRDFPYGKPSTYKRCSWWVRVLDYEPLLMAA